MHLRSLGNYLTAKSAVSWGLLFSTGGGIVIISSGLRPNFIYPQYYPRDKNDQFPKTTKNGTLLYNPKVGFYHKTVFKMIPLVIISFRCFIYVSIQVIFLPLTKFTESGCVPVANVHKPETGQRIHSHCYQGSHFSPASNSKQQAVFRRQHFLKEILRG